MHKRSRILVSMNQMNQARRVQVVRSLVEGNSINSTVRMTGAAKNTVLKLLVELGTACAKYHDQHMTGLHCQYIECDEIWSFCYSKAKNVPSEHRGEWGYGDVWTWTALSKIRKAENNAMSSTIATSLLGVLSWAQLGCSGHEVPSRISSEICFAAKAGSFAAMMGLPTTM